MWLGPGVPNPETPGHDISITTRHANSLVVILGRSITCPPRGLCGVIAMEKNALPNPQHNGTDLL